MLSIGERRQSRSVAATGSRHTRDAADVMMMCVVLMYFAFLNHAMRNVVAVKLNKERTLNKCRSAAICSRATANMLSAERHKQYMHQLIPQPINRRPLSGRWFATF